MRRYRKWVVTLGLVAAAPNASLAGPFDFFRPKPAVSADGALNQQVAEQVAAKLRAARLKGADIEIEFQDGTLTLKGQVADAGTKALATQLGSGVEGVKNVNNLMTTAAPAGPIQQVSAQAPANPFARTGVQPAAFEASAGQPSGIQQVAAAQQAAAQRQQQPATSAPAAPLMRRPAPTAAPTSRPAAPAGVSNQQSAEQVAAALGRAGLSGYDIEVRCENGICTLAGTVSSNAQRDAAIRAASTVTTIAKINPQLRVASAGGIMPAAYQDEAAAAPGYPMPPGYPGVAPGYPAGVVPPPPGWAQPGVGAVGPVYDQPNVPQHAWPNYAAYPNYSAVTYPRQYSASAWPYIGPFYPYPQVPLGWREVTLEWDDGHWFLDFNDRTDKWWWFFNPKNW